jgi:hypothetical protein
MTARVTAPLGSPPLAYTKVPAKRLVAVAYLVVVTILPGFIFFHGAGARDILEKVCARLIQSEYLFDAAATLVGLASIDLLIIVTRPMSISVPNREKS